MECGGGALDAPYSITAFERVLLKTFKSELLT